MKNFNKALVLLMTTAGVEAMEERESFNENASGKRLISSLYSEKENPDNNPSANKKQRLLMVTEVDSEGRTPLHLAALTGQLEEVQSLCANFPSLLEKVETQGGTALHLAAFKGQLKVVQYLCENHPGLLEKVANLGTTVLHAAAGYGKLEVVKYLCQNHPGLMKKNIIDNISTLHIAARAGHLEVVKYLCARCPELIVAQNSAGRTAKSYTLTRHKSIIDFLGNFEHVYNLGLVPDSPIEPSLLSLEDLDKVDFDIMSSILPFQPLNHQKAQKIIDAIKNIIDQENNQFDEKIHKEYHDSFFQLLDHDPLNSLDKSEEELRADFYDRKQAERAEHDQKMSHGNALIKLFQKYRMPNLRSLVVNSLTPKLLNYGKYGNNQNQFATRNDHNTLLRDLVDLAKQGLPLGWTDIEPGIRLNTENLKDYMHEIYFRINNKSTNN